MKETVFDELVVGNLATGFFGQRVVSRQLSTINDSTFLAKIELKYFNVMPLALYTGPQSTMRATKSACPDLS